MSQAPEQTSTPSVSTDRRNRRQQVDRRRTRNRITEARARHIGVTLDRRRAPSLATTFAAAWTTGWPLALRERCATLWRPRRSANDSAQVQEVVASVHQEIQANSPN